MKPYTAPTLTPFGTIADLTRGGGQGVHIDSVFLNGILIDQVIGNSIDKCIVTDPNIPPNHPCGPP